MSGLSGLLGSHIYICLLRGARHDVELGQTTSSHKGTDQRLLISEMLLAAPYAAQVVANLL